MMKSYICFLALTCLCHTFVDNAFAIRPPAVSARVRARSSSCTATSDYLNWNVINNGFDILIGNPYSPSNSQDPDNFKKQIFNITEDNKSTYLMFVNVDIYSFQSSSETITSVQAYTKTTSQTISASASYDGFTGSGSDGYTKTKETTTVDSSYIIYTTSTGKVYQLQISGDLPEFNSFFVEQVQGLPSSFDSTQFDDSTYAFRAFIDNFGTHYATSIMMGGYLEQTSTTTQYEYNQMTQNGVDISAEAGYEMAASVGYSDSTTKTVSSNYSDSVTTQSVVYVGGCDLGGTWNDWTSTLSGNPVPISYSVTDIPTLLSETSSLATSEQISALRDAITYYLQVNGDVAALYPTVEVNQDTAPGDYGSIATAYCPAGMLLVGGGCNTTEPENDDSAKRWRLSALVPVTNSAGNQGFQCGANQDYHTSQEHNSAIPYAVCASESSDSEYSSFTLKQQIVKTKSQSTGKYYNSVEAVCPKGYLLLGGGCSSPNNSAGQQHPWRVTNAYPSESSNSFVCEMGNDEGNSNKNQLVEAYAICGQYNSQMEYLPNLPLKYSIITEDNNGNGHGSGQATATCPEDYVVMGGGCQCDSDYGSMNHPWMMRISYPVDNGWFCLCAQDQDESHHDQKVTSSAVCIQI